MSDSGLNAYVAAFLQENAIHNLSAARTEERVWEHVHDSLAPNELPDLELPKQARVLDVGSGGGLPGVPLAITHPEWNVTLLDSVTKKAEAVNRIIASVQAVQPIHAFAMAGRAEEWGQSKEHRFQYDIVVARAVAALPTLLEYVIPFLTQDGVAMLYKGPTAVEEIAQSKRAFERLNAQLDEVRAYGPADNNLPQKMLLIVRRNGLLEDQYPRANGIPKKKPIQ